MPPFERAAHLGWDFDRAAGVEGDADVVVQRDQFAGGGVEDPAPRMAHLAVKPDLSADRAQPVAGPWLRRPHRAALHRGPAEAVALVADEGHRPPFLAFRCALALSARHAQR